MGPLDAGRPWSASDIAGVYRFLQRLWRSMIDEATGQARVADRPLDDQSLRRLHRTIMIVRKDFEELRFNTAIARLMELTGNAARFATGGGLPRAMAEPLVLMVAPLAPHIAEELWNRLGHRESLAYADFPVADPQLAAERTLTIPVQVNGKTRFTVEVDADAGQQETERQLRAHPGFAQYTTGLTIERLVIVPGKIANIVAR
jgi:leucyl-tRNA synthetase